MSNDYSSLDDDSLEYLLNHEVERRKAVEEKALAIIRVNVLILGIFVPVVAIILREDVMNSISPIVENIYTLSGIGVSILALGSSSLIFLFAHAQLSSISRGVDELIEEIDSSENVQTGLARMTLENIEPFNDLVGMLVLTVFFTSLSVPLLLLGIAKPFVGVNLVIATYVLMFSITGVMFSYLFIKVTWAGFVQSYQILQSEYSRAKTTLFTTVHNSAISDRNFEGIVSLLSLLVGLALGMYLAPDLPRIWSQQVTPHDFLAYLITIIQGILITISTSIAFFLFTVLVFVYRKKQG